MNEWPCGAGRVLISLARCAIAEVLGIPSESVFDEASWVSQPGASFVTLTIAGQLRGCIGSLSAYQPLSDDVRDNAVSAAFHDPRFPALSGREFTQIHIEVSVLSPAQPLSFSSKQDALTKLRPGVDGVILMARRRRATFLPQVWEELSDPAEFIAHLMNKAGLPADFWDDSVRIETYSVTAFEESD